MILAAIKSGTDPVAPLPSAAFHRTLEEPLYCPKCEATYMLIADYDWAISRHFENESRRHITLLRKTIFRGHAHGHHITHFETNGVVVTAHTAPNAPTPLEALSRRRNSSTRQHRILCLFYALWPSPSPST